MNECLSCGMPWKSVPGEPWDAYYCRVCYEMLIEVPDAGGA